MRITIKGKGYEIFSETSTNQLLCLCIVCATLVVITCILYKIDAIVLASFFTFLGVVIDRLFGKRKKGKVGYSAESSKL